MAASYDDVTREEWGEQVYRWLETEVLTEEHTDALIDAFASRVPWLPTFISRRLLDHFLPETALQAVEDAMQRLGWLRSDRFRGSPFDASSPPPPQDAA